MNDEERTLVLLKPDAVKRRLMGEIIGRYEAKGLTVRAMELSTIDAKTARKHYAEHVGRDYYAALEEFITSGPLVAMVLEGRRVISVVRAMNGATDCAEALPGTIRGDFGTEKNHNLVHASDCLESAEREIGLWFPHVRGTPMAHTIETTMPTHPRMIDMTTLTPDTRIIPGMASPKTITSKARKPTTTFVIGLPAGRVRIPPFPAPGCATNVTSPRRRSYHRQATARADAPPWL